MKPWILTFLTAWVCGSVLAQEPSAVFVPPEAYPPDRYEASWSKNPFTLKTAPAVVENISFAKDLAIGSHYGDKDNPTIFIVNTKTHERTKLKKGETASNGMKLTSIKLGDTRKLTTVEVTLGTETSELTYSSEYLSQLASSEGGKPQAQQAVMPQQGRPMPGVQPQRAMPGIPPKVQLPTGNPGMNRPSTAGVQPNMQRNVGGSAQPAMNVPPPVSGNNINLTVPGGNLPQTGGPLISDANSSAPPPLPPRRRINP